MKKIFLLLICLALCACQSNSGNVISHPEDYVKALKAYEVPEFRDDDISDNTEFNAFLDEEFKKYMGNDYLNMHFSLEDYAAYAIEKPEVGLGELNTDFKKTLDENAELLEKLQAFDFDTLSFKQQVDYVAMEYSLLETMAMNAYGQYQLLFDRNTSLHSNLITNLTEFAFRNREDYDDYLLLLGDVDRYLEEALAYTESQAEKGIALQDYTLDETLAYIEGFVSKTDDNAIILDFANEVEASTILNTEEKEELLKECEKLVQEEIIPAYENLYDGLEALRGKSSLAEDDAGAYSYDPNYGELLVYINMSDNQGLDELYDLIYKIFVDEFVNVLSVTYDEELYEKLMDYTYNPTAYPPLGESPEAIVEFLIDHIGADYPDIGDASYLISLLDESIADPNIMAYYLIAPIDNPDYNVIRINPDTMASLPQIAYSTIAHEGFPGHLYANVYEAGLDLHPYRNCLSFIAYTEGQAMMASRYAYNYICDKDDYFTEAMSFNDQGYAYMLEALAQIGVNGYGWSLEEMQEELSDLSVLDDETAKAIYQSAVGSAGSIIAYGGGLAEFTDLQERYFAAYGEDDIAFNNATLEYGSLPFNILRSLIFD